MKMSMHLVCLLAAAATAAMSGTVGAEGAGNEAATTPAVERPESAPAEAPQTFPWDGEVKGSSVRLRSGASTRFATIKVLKEHEKLLVVAEDKGWLKVRMPKDVACWVGTSFVKDNGDGTGTVGGKNINIRITPNSDHYPVGQLSNATVALVRDESGKTITEGEFTKIIAPDQAFAWIGAEFVSKATQAACEASAPVDAANGSANVEAAPATDAAQAGSEANTPTPATPASPAAATDGDMQAFAELDRLFIEQLGKPSAQRDFSEVKKLYQQFADFCANQDLKDKSLARIALITETEQKIADAIDEAGKTPAPVVEAGPAPSFVTEGYIADHGRDAQVPATHALVDADGKVLYYIRWDGGMLDRLWQKHVKIGGEVKHYDDWDKPVVVIQTCEELS